MTDSLLYHRHVELERIATTTASVRATSTQERVSVPCRLETAALKTQGTWRMKYSNPPYQWAKSVAGVLLCVRAAALRKAAGANQKKKKLTGGVLVAEKNSGHQRGGWEGAPCVGHLVRQGQVVVDPCDASLGKFGPARLHSYHGHSAPTTHFYKKLWNDWGERECTKCVTPTMMKGLRCAQVSPRRLAPAASLLLTVCFGARVKLQLARAVG